MLIVNDVAVPVDIKLVIPIYVVPEAITEVTTLLLLSYNAPAYKFPPTPTPPVTVNAPVVVDVELAVFVIPIALVVVAPRLVTLCKVLLFQIVTAPVDELIEVSVPAVIELTNPPPVPEVRTC